MAPTKLHTTQNQHQAPPPTSADVQPMAGVIKLSLKINNVIWCSQLKNSQLCTKLIWNKIITQN